MGRTKTDERRNEKDVDKLYVNKAEQIKLIECKWSAYNAIQYISVDSQLFN